MNFNSILCNKSNLTFDDDDDEIPVNEETKDLICIGNNSKSRSKIQFTSKSGSDKYEIRIEPHIVSLKLIANKEVEKDAFSLQIKGPTKTNTFDKASLDGDNYTYLFYD